LTFLSYLSNLLPNLDSICVIRARLQDSTNDRRSIRSDEDRGHPKIPKQVKYSIKLINVMFYENRILKSAIKFCPEICFSDYFYSAKLAQTTKSLAYSVIQGMK